MRGTRGVIYVAVGDPTYRRMAHQSIASLRRCGFGAPVAVVCDEAGARDFDRDDVRTIVLPPSADRFQSRAVKTVLHRHTPFDETLYLDCDTLLIWPPDGAWDSLRDADVALALDPHPTVGHALDAAPREGRGSAAEWEATRACGAASPYYNGGVVLWRRSAASDRFFEAWHAQWRRFATIDQFALVRAIHRCGTPIATLQPRYNQPSPGVRDVADAARAGICVLHFCPRPQQRRMSETVRQLTFDLHTISLRTNAAAAGHGFRGTNFW